jgi:hypothetical protein
MRVKPITRDERRQLRAAVKQAIAQYRDRLRASNQPEDHCQTEALQRLLDNPPDELRHVPPDQLPNIIVMVAVTARQARWYANGRWDGSNMSIPAEEEAAAAVAVLERYVRRDEAFVTRMKSVVRTETALDRIPLVLAPRTDSKTSIRSRLIGRVRGAVLTHTGKPNITLVRVLSDIVLGLPDGKVTLRQATAAPTPAELLAKPPQI